MNRSARLIVPKPHAGDTNPLSSARALLNLSRRELADKLNTSLYALVRWERGDLTPSKDVLIHLDALLNPKVTRRNRDSTTSN